MENLHKNSISVVVTSFNGERFLNQAIESVLSQDESVDEIIVIDDGSTLPVSRMKDLCGKDIKIIRQNNSGQGSAINNGIKRSKGELIAFLDHDDYWPKDKIRNQRALLKDSLHDVVVGEVVNEWSLEFDSFRQKNMGHARVFGACLFRRDVFAKIGYLIEDKSIHEVIEWWSRAGNRLNVGYSDGPALFRRIHGSNQTLKVENLNRSDLIKRVRENIKRNQA